MRAFLVFACLVFVGGSITARPVAGQYPFLDPDDPCYPIIQMYIFRAELPAGNFESALFLAELPNDPATWNDPDKLQKYASALHNVLTAAAWHAFPKLPSGDESTQELESLKQDLTTLLKLDCLLKVKALIDRIDARLKELGVDVVAVATDRGHDLLKREQLIADCHRAQQQLAEQAVRILGELRDR